MVELSWDISSVTELDFDNVSTTVKRVIPKFNGKNLPHVYIKNSSEADVDSKTSVKTNLTDKGYTWDFEI